MSSKVFFILLYDSIILSERRGGMIYSEFEVQIPKFTRLKQQNENTYVYYLLGRKGDKKGNEKDIAICIGRLSREGFLHPNENYFSLFGQCDKPLTTMTLTKKDDQSKIGAVLALRSIAQDNGLYDCLKLAFDGYADLILSLSCYYSIARDSAAQLYSDFMFDHWIDDSDIASESTISRLFNERITEDRIDAFRSSFLRHRFLLGQQRGRKKRKTILVDIDSTNINCAGKDLELAERGHPKDDEELPQVNYAYFYERNSGIPVFYDAFYGSITDLTHCLTGIKQFFANLNMKAKDVYYRFILDRGYFSKPNITAINDSGIEFAIMGKRNSMFKEHIQRMDKEVRSSSSMISLGKYGICFKDKAFSNEDATDYYIYLFYDASADIKERACIENKIMQAKKALEGKKTDRTLGLQRTYGNIFDIQVTSNKTIKSITLKKDKIDEAFSTCGYFWIISNVETTPEEMLKAYRERDEIEKSFRAVKTENDMDKTYAQTDQALKAKVFMGYLTAILRSELVHRTREYVSRHTNMSTQKILLALDKIIIRKTPAGYLQKYALTSQQQEIMNAIGMNKKAIDALIRTINIAYKS